MSQRRAYICTHPDHAKTNMHYRRFLLPGEEVPECKEHKRKMVPQSNRPYNVKYGGKVPPK